VNPLARHWFFLALMLPAAAFAENGSSRGSGPDTVGTVIQLGLGLLVVIAVIFFCAWLARRVQGMHGMNTQAMKVVAVLSVGQRERVALLQVGEQQILIGITPQSVRTLHVFDEQVISPREGGSNDFASKLQAMLSRNTVTPDRGVDGTDSDNRGER